MSDYISREDVKKLLWERISLATFMRRGIPNAMKSLSLISEELEKIPAADVRPVVRGEWEQQENGTWVCSKCKSWIPDEQHFYARFCLHCGAKMKGVPNG